MKWVSITITVITIVVVCLVVPLCSLIDRGAANFVLRELVYKQMADRLTRNCYSEWEQVKALNSWIYVNEDQSVAWLDRITDVISFNPMFCFVRGIGWCDQKAWGLTTLLATRRIKARMMCFPCHTIAEVIADNSTRLIDGSFNCEVVSEQGSYSRTDRQVYAGDCINLYQPAYGDYNNKITLRNTVNRLLDCYPRWYVVSWTSVFFRTHPTVYLDGATDVYGNDLSESTTAFYWWNRYSSLEYRILYEARVWHLLGEYARARQLYASLIDTTEFRDDALLFMIRLSLDENDIDKATSYIDIAKSSSVEIPRKSYLLMVDSYLNRYQEVYGWK